jgi:hypothetical protein
VAPLGGDVALSSTCKAKNGVLKAAKSLTEIYNVQE